MNSEKKMPIYLGISAVLLISTVFYLDFSTLHDSDSYIPEKLFTPKAIDKLTVTKTVDVDREKIFKIMADVKNYPRILPQNILAVKILAQDDSSIEAEEQIIEAGIRTTLHVKHTFIPYEKHIIEILDGDAKGTKITAAFEEVENSTKITANVDFNLHGILSPFAFLATGNMNSAMNTIILTFADYAKGFEKKSEKIVDDIYRELLVRPADAEALEHFAPLIENGVLSAADLRIMVLDSTEYKNLLKPNEIYGINDLNEEPKKIVQDVYWELLDRVVDPLGLQYYGSIVQANKITKEDLRQIIMTTPEYHWRHSEIKIDLTVLDGTPMVLEWAKPSIKIPINGYKVYRDGEYLAFIALEFKNKLDNSFIDHTVKEGETYSYHITTVSGDFEFDILAYSENASCVVKDGIGYDCNPNTVGLAMPTDGVCSIYLSTVMNEFGIWTSDPEMLEFYLSSWPGAEKKPVYGKYCLVE